jgi:coenzyme F420-dependent glucose-6-phosphate dehydrogenase
MLLGYHASHEQFAPSDLLALAQRAASAGFRIGLNSDHFHPWTEHQGHSGFAWSWMGAALATTPFDSLGVVSAPGQRYHPAILAQALATLCEMFDGRAWVALGSGEALNEMITGDRWPAKQERHTRLRECVDIMRALFRGEEVTHRGLVAVEQARLYTRPSRPPLLAGAAVTPETARWVGEWADALITVSQPREQMARVVDAFRQGGGDRKPMFLKLQVSWAPTYAEAERAARIEWASNAVPSSILSDLRTPAQFAALAGVVGADALAGAVRISSELSQHLNWLHEDAQLGFDHVYVHNVGRNQAAFIDTFAESVLPKLCATQR